MRVNPKFEPAAVPRTAATQANRSEPASTQDEVALTHSEKLRSALRQVPDMRPEAVARAKSLLADPSYPSDSALEKVAGVLANHIKAADKSA